MRALAPLGVRPRVIDPRAIDAWRRAHPDLVFHLVGRLEQAAEVARRLQNWRIPFTGPTARGLARMAVDRDLRALVRGIDVMSGDVVVEGEDIGVALIGNDPMLVIPAPGAGHELTSVAIGEGGAVEFDLSGEGALEGAHGAGAGATAELAMLAKRLRDELELRDFAYLVVRLTPGGHLWLVELDPIPSLARDAPLSVTAQRERWEYSYLVQRIFLEAWRRTRRERPQPAAAPG